jgi:hypothetical protein
MEGVGEAAGVGQGMEVDMKRGQALRDMLMNEWNGTERGNVRAQSSQGVSLIVTPVSCNHSIIIIFFLSTSMIVCACVCQGSRNASFRSACATAGIRGIGVVACFDSGKVHGLGLHRRCVVQVPLFIVSWHGLEVAGRVTWLALCWRLQHHGRADTRDV